MKPLSYIVLLLLLPFTAAFGQARVVLSNGYVVENGGTAAKSVYFVVSNSNANAIVPGAGWLVSENEFDFLQWNIGTANGTYTVPFGFSNSKYLPLTLDINPLSPATGNGVVKFSTYHTIPNQEIGVTSLTGNPSDVNNLDAFELPGSPYDSNNSFNIVDRFYIIDANTGYTTKPTATDITFSYISGTANTEVGAPNILTESRLMAQRFNSTPNDTTWSDWFGYGCTDVVVNNVGTVQTGPVPSIDMYRSWSLWDQTQPLPLSLTSTDNPCKGSDDGTASATILGGAAPYTYLWSNGGTTSSISSLTAGNYTVSVNDSRGCTSTSTVSVTEPVSAVTVTTASQTNVPCNGETGSVTANAASGGTGPYSYSWAPSGGTTLTATGLTAGTYTLNVTDSRGCTGTDIVVITQPNSLSATANATANVSCNGNNNGSASATVTGGTIPYTYTWTGGAGSNATATGLTAGTYTVSILDNNGCTSSATVTITQPTTLSATANTTANVTCNGNDNGSASSSVTGGTAPYTYAWTGGAGSSSGATGLTAGTYTLNVTDNNGCASSATAIITQPANALSVSTTINSNVTCNGISNGSASSDVSGGTSPYTYAWTGGAGNNANASGLSAGTYTVGVTDNNGCTNSATVTITQPANGLSVSTTITANVSCNGNANGSALSSVSGGEIPYTYAWTGGAGSNANASNLTAGTYTVSVKDNNGCTGSATAIITQPSTLGATANTTADVTCNGNDNGSASSSVTGGTAPYTYAWTGGAGSNATATGLTAGTYTLNVTDNNGCASSATAIITEPTLLSTTANTTANVSCNGGDNGTASSSTTGGTMPYTYAWSSGAGSNATATGLAAGTYSISVTDSHGCTSSAIVNITQPTSGLSVSASTTTNVSCHGDANGSASSAVSGGTSPYTYAWTGGAGNNTNASNLTAGTYTLSVTDNNGCSGSATVTITQPATSLSVSANTTANVTCNGNDNGTASSTVSGGTIPYTYSWTGGAGNNADASNLTAGTYTLSVTDNNGCTSSATITITQPTLLTTSASATSNITCNGNNNGDATATTTGGIAPYTYSWSNGTSTLSTSNPTGSVLSVGTYTVTVTDNNSCTATASVVITQPASSLSISMLSSSNSSGCITPNGSATASSASGGTAPYTYSWSPSGGTNLTATGLSVGTYTITVTDNNGCTAIATATINQVASNLAITMASSTNSTGCITPNGSADANAATGGSVPYTYSWSPSGGTNLTATGLSAGTYTITVTDGNGCTAVATATISQVASTLAITMGSSVNSTACTAPNGSATANAATGGSAPYTYTWSPSGGTNLTATGLGAGTYTIIVTDGNGCAAMATVSISQVPSTLAITMDTTTNVTKCGSPNGSATANAATGGLAPYTYFWSPSGGNGLTAIDLSAAVYTIMVTDANGCSATASADILDKSAPPVISVCCDSTIQPGQTVQLDVSPEVTGYTYSWSPATGLSCTDCPDPIASPTITTAYSVTVYDNNGCSATDSLLIKINDDCGSVYVPSGFSPNGDGHNDYFVVTGMCVSDYSLLIYDRWGNKVFETNDINNSWNGDYNGKPMNPGNYVYYLKAQTLNGQTISRHGDIALVR
jgi:large repetitive protein